MTSNPNPSRDPTQLRSHRWFGPDDLRSFGHRSRIKGMGFGDEDYAGKPVIGILNTWSELNTCHSHLRERAAEVRCVLTKGGAQFVTPLSLSALSGNPVHGELFSLTEESEMGHIELSRAADLVVIAPAVPMIYAVLMALPRGGLLRALLPLAVFLCLALGLQVVPWLGAEATHTTHNVPHTVFYMSEKIAHRSLQGWVDQIRRDLYQRHENKVPLGETGVRNNQIGGIQYHVVVEQDIEVDQSGPIACTWLTA